MEPGPPPDGSNDAANVPILNGNTGPISHTATGTKGKRLTLKIRWFLYVSHFLSAWGARMWQFGVGLFMVIISPGSLLLTAVYGFAMGGSILLLGPPVGDWIDRTPRLRAARISLLIQNISIAACSVVLYFVITYETQIRSYWPNSGLMTLSYAVIIAIAIVSNLAGTGTTIAVERDWIVEICEKDTDLLAATSAKLKAIDLVTNIVAPIATGQIMFFTSQDIGALFIGAWNLVSVVVEYYLLWKVHELVPRLKDKTYASNNTKDYDGRRSTRCASCPRSMLSGVFILVRGWKTYINYKVAFAGLALAFLYMTVLGFDNITVGYAYTQGINESVMGALMAAGALVGILGTVIYPRVTKRIGLERTGLYGLFSQLMCLSICVASVWAPGSPFDPYFRSRKPGTIPANRSNSSLVGFNQRHGSPYETSVRLSDTGTILNSHSNSSLDGYNQKHGSPFDISSRSFEKGTILQPYSNSSLVDWKNPFYFYHGAVYHHVLCQRLTRVADFSSISSHQEDRLRLKAYNPLTESPTVSNATTTTKTDWTSYISVGMLMLGIIGARCGLWIADLTINQLFLETIEDSERGIVIGVQTSLNKLMDMLKFAMVMAAPEPEVFGILVVISFVVVGVGLALYAKFVFTVRKHLCHFKKLMVCCPRGYESI